MRPRARRRHCTAGRRRPRPASAAVASVASVAHQNAMETALPYAFVVGYVTQQQQEPQQRRRQPPQTRATGAAAAPPVRSGQALGELCVGVYRQQPPTFPPKKSATCQQPPEVEWHRLDAFFARGDHRGLVVPEQLRGLDQLLQADRQRVVALVRRGALAVASQDRVGRQRLVRAQAAAAAAAGPAAGVAARHLHHLLHNIIAPPLMLVLLALPLLLLDLMLPRLALLEKAGRAARVRRMRMLYTAVNRARVAKLRLKCRHAPPAFGASEVAPGFFVGSMEDAHNLGALQERNVVAVITVSPGIPPPFVHAGIRYLCLDVIDLPDERLREHFFAAVCMHFHWLQEAGAEGCDDDGSDDDDDGYDDDDDDDDGYGDDDG